MSNTDELRQIRTALQNGGGDEMINEQHKLGKNTARERISKLFDEGSFVETDAFVCSNFSLDSENKPSAEGVVTGYGSVDGRLVYAYAQDWTVTKGAISSANVQKITKIMDMALKMGAPIVSVLDSQGAKIDTGLEALEAMGKILKKASKLSGVVPQISLILGACAGCEGFLPVIGDFTVMSSKNSLMFLNGPSVSGGKLSLEELGGADTCSVKTGTASFVGSSEDECFGIVRELLSYLPSNNIEASPYLEEEIDINNVSEQLNNVAEDVDVKTVISEIADGRKFFETSPAYAQNIVTGFIRLNGSTVGVVANQCKINSGRIDVKASKKAASFISFCDSFNISILTVTSTVGFENTTSAEFDGILKSGAGLLYSFVQATVPKVNLIIGKAYGAGYLSMNSKHIGADMVFAWPSAEISVMSAESAANILFNDKIAASDSPAKERENLIDEYSKKYASPYVAASLGYVDDVFEAHLSRPRLINAFEMLMSKREVLPARKHGNMPL